MSLRGGFLFFPTKQSPALWREVAAPPKNKGGGSQRHKFTRCTVEKFLFQTAKKAIRISLHLGRQGVPVLVHCAQSLTCLSFIIWLCIDPRRYLFHLFLVSRKSVSLQERHQLNLIVGMQFKLRCLLIYLDNFIPLPQLTGQGGFLIIETPVMSGFSAEGKTQWGLVSIVCSQRGFYF